MKQRFIYDLPTRIFHWLFALLFLVAFTIGKNIDDDDLLFSYHMIAGITLCFLVLLRVVWGIFGSKYSRFTGFSLNPKELLLYLKGILTGDKRKWAGHNPASSWAAIVMMSFALGLGITGYLMTNSGGGDDLEDIHELLANGFIIVVLFHITGLALHTLRHRDNIWKSMINGEKTDLSEENELVPPYRTLGMLVLLIILSFSTYLTLNFDDKSRNIRIFGTQFHLGEAEDD